MEVTRGKRGLFYCRYYGLKKNSPCALRHWGATPNGGEIMAGFNKVILVGNMTRDVEIRTLPSGSMVGGFGIAINRRIRLATGEEREEVCFVDCTAFDKKADILRQYTRKGSLILVEGRRRLDSWTDKTTGQPRSKLNVVVENIQLLDKRDPNAQQGGYQQAPGGWGQPQGGYQQPQSGWGQAQSSWNQPAAGNPPPAFQPPPWTHTRIFSLTGWSGS